VEQNQLFSIGQVTYEGRSVPQLDADSGSFAVLVHFRAGRRDTHETTDELPSRNAGLLWCNDESERIPSD
jgi:hypothetical protein